MDKFHPQVAALLSEMEAVSGGPRLPAASLKRWAESLLESEARSIVGDQLVALSIRFAREGGMLASQQMLGLAMLLVDERRVRGALDLAGMETAETRRLIEAARGNAGALGKGLAPPRTTRAPGRTKT